MMGDAEDLPGHGDAQHGPAEHPPLELGVAGPRFALVDIGGCGRHGVTRAPLGRFRRVFVPATCRSAGFWLLWMGCLARSF